MTQGVKTKKILNIAVPTAIENLLHALVGFVDTLMISRLGLIAVTAVGISNTVISVYLAVILALGIAASSLISRALGGKDPAKARQTAAQSTLLSMGIGLVLGLVSVLFSDQLLGLMRAEPDVIELARPYFRLVGGSALFIALQTVPGSILRAAGDAKTPMLVNAGVNIINIVIDYLLIFGIGPFPALGILGTAIGTVVSRVIGTILMFRKVRQTELAFGWRDLVRRSNYSELLRLSLPAVLERLVLRGGQVIYFGLIVLMGTKVYAAHSIAGNIETFSYMPAQGLAAAASILVGNSIGAGRNKQAYGYWLKTIRMSLVIMALGGVVLFFGSRTFAGWFTEDAAAIGMVVIALRIDAFNQIPVGINQISAGALQGSGDTRSPLYSTAAGIWVIRLVGTYVLGIRLGMGIAGVWIAILIDNVARALFLAVRFRQRIRGL